MIAIIAGKCGESIVLETENFVAVVPDGSSFMVVLNIGGTMSKFPTRITPQEIFESLPPGIKYQG